MSDGADVTCLKSGPGSSSCSVVFSHLLTVLRYCVEILISGLEKYSVLQKQVLLNFVKYWDFKISRKDRRSDGWPRTHDLNRKWTCTTDVFCVLPVHSCQIKQCWLLILLYFVELLLLKAWLSLNLWICYRNESCQKSRNSCRMGFFSRMLCDHGGWQCCSLSCCANPCLLVVFFRFECFSKKRTTVPIVVYYFDILYLVLLQVFHT